MEKRLNKKLEQYIVQFKDDIRNKLNEINFTEKEKVGEFIEYIYEHEKLCLTKDDFIKRKRLKNSIPNLNRCTAKRANGEQCTRRRKTDCEFCGTHHKGSPHGLMAATDGQTESNKKTVDIFAEEINGIIYYFDKYNNVYKISDILEGKENPQIIAKYNKNGNDVKIISF
jgi:hypothetical protein